MVLQIILVGQPQLRDTVCLPELLQLAQRIGVDEHIEPLDAHETRQYIWHRLRVAGGSISVFRGRALALVSKASGGVPRLINQLCDRALAYGYSQHAQRIDHELMRQAIEDRLRGGVFPGRKRTETRASIP